MTANYPDFRFTHNLRFQMSSFTPVCFAHTTMQSTHTHTHINTQLSITLPCCNFTYFYGTIRKTSSVLLEGTAMMNADTDLN